ncbi:DME family drug/metabolite transporter [Kribbella voronezhensis]|uniref:DME family drug/metabolite transporter n=1 Tax=Kribbella voronezhensis TaxID=2512212 RepID=A0A4R7SUG2_9ACTN|nr:EamA family transporter [Kribbella voronezhensis]TDU82409.1 DME family drug/metabolite transporter [Kribbella voronezhensis]
MHHRLAPSSARGLLYVALAGVAWGTGGAAGVLLSHNSGLNSTAISFWRLLGGALWLAVARRLLRRDPITLQFAAAPLRYLLSGLGLAACQLGYFAAIPRLGVGVSTVISLGVGPLFITLGARERITATLPLAVLGLTLLVSDGRGVGHASIAGVAFSVLSGAGYALTTLLNRDEQDPITSATLGFGAGALILLPLGLAGDITPAVGSWPVLAYFGLVPTALAYALFYTGLRAVRASTAAVVALIEPLLATFIGVLAFHEHLTALSLIGAAVLLLAVVRQARRE